jgi:hypothetical protein
MVRNPIAIGSRFGVLDASLSGSIEITAFRATEAIGRRPAGRRQRRQATPLNGKVIS